MLGQSWCAANGVHQVASEQKSRRNRKSTADGSDEAEHHQPQIKAVGMDEDGPNGPAIPLARTSHVAGFFFLCLSFSMTLWWIRNQSVGPMWMKKQFRDYIRENCTSINYTLHLHKYLIKIKYFYLYLKFPEFDYRFFIIIFFPSY